jgi:HMG (high mobility group) box
MSRSNTNEGAAPSQPGGGGASSDPSSSAYNHPSSTFDMSHRGGGYGGSAGVGGYPGESNNARRYTLSDVDPLTGGGGQQVPIHGGGGMSDLLGNHSQRSHQSQPSTNIPGGNIGYRGDLRASDSPSNNSSNHLHVPQGGGGGYPYGGAELSPTHLAHRMSLGFYPMSAGSATSPNYGALGDSMDLSGRGLSSVGAGGGTQADREEELLLNLLIARRQRGRMAGDNKGGRGVQSTLADDLMRLRQSRGGATGPGGPRRSGSIPQIPGMPPLYAETMSTGASMVPPNMYPTMDGYGRNPGLKSEVFPSAHLQQQIQNASERIDRSPGRFHISDARMSEMRELSERSVGFKRGMGSMGMGMMMGHHPHHGMGFVDGGMPDFSHAGGNLDMRGDANLQPPFKKKRTHKKKPLDMPRRPLSAYNLFFSEERERILKEIEKKEGKDDEIPGAEAPEEEKPKALLRPLIPAEKKRRPHRKTHGKISFQELARMVGERWKNLPDDERKYYQDLAQEDMKRQKAAMEEYYAKQNVGSLHLGDDLDDPTTGDESMVGRMEHSKPVVESSAV